MIFIIKLFFIAASYLIITEGITARQLVIGGIPEKPIRYIG